MEMRIFWSVLAALVVFALVSTGFNALAQHRHQQEAEEAAQVVFQQMSAAAQAERQLSIDDSTVRKRSAAADFDRRTLNSSERCVDSSVVRAQGHDNQQIGIIENPVNCVGGVADQPIRRAR